MQRVVPVGFKLCSVSLPSAHSSSSLFCCHFQVVGFLLHNHSNNSKSQFFRHGVLCKFIFFFSCLFWQLPLGNMKMVADNNKEKEINSDD